MSNAEDEDIGLIEEVFKQPQMPLQRSITGAPSTGNEITITEVQLIKDAIAGDYFSTRDPNVAALCLCLNQPMVKHRVIQVRYGKRDPQRVVEFEFKGHEKVFRMAVNCLMDIRSSLEVKNVNIGEFLAQLRNVKTIILSCV